MMNDKIIKLEIIYSVLSILVLILFNKKIKCSFFECINIVIYYKITLVSIKMF